MKKLMIAAAIVCATAMSQAAQVAWGNAAATSPIVGLDGSTKITSANATAWNLKVQLMLVGDPDTGVGTPVTAINNMNAGALSGATTWSYTYGDDASNGDKFYALLTMTVDGKDYQMIVDNNWAIAATDNTGKDTFTWAAGNYGGLGTEGQKNVWVAQVASFRFVATKRRSSQGGVLL